MGPSPCERVSFLGRLRSCVRWAAFLLFSVENRRGTQRATFGSSQVVFHGWMLSVCMGPLLWYFVFGVSRSGKACAGEPAFGHHGALKEARRGAVVSAVE